VISANLGFFGAFLRDNMRWLLVGFLLALASSFGQTFFIALFSSDLREAFGLSHGEFGSVYMVGTLMSAATLYHLGRLADIWPPRALAMLVLSALALAASAMALVGLSWIFLIFVIFALRLFGQGMSSHLSQTLMARWFVATRGRALAVASFGHPVGEALLPILLISVIAAVGWRGAWWLAAAILIFGFAPLIWFLLGKTRNPSSVTKVNNEHPGLDGRHHARRDVMRSRLFWMIVPGVLAPSFIGTAVFFLPSHIAEVKGWNLEVIASRYWIYAVASVLSSVLAGIAVDRFSARHCLAFYQLPTVFALLSLWQGTDIFAVSVLFAMTGLTSGAASTVHAALWAELYGTRHIGSIKALAHAVMVFASAAGPGLIGVIIDVGVDFPSQAPYFAVIVLGICLLFGWIGQRLKQPGIQMTPA
jgi:sugar phosphate permease